MEVRGAFRVHIQDEQLNSETDIFEFSLGVNFALRAHKGPCIHLAPTQTLVFFLFLGGFFVFIKRAKKPGWKPSYVLRFSCPAI